MIIKKTGGHIYGAILTAAERKAMNMEIQRELAEYDLKNSTEIDAIVLWVLLSEFDFDENDLKKFHDSFTPQLKALCERYEMNDSENVWLCTHLLLDRGIDVAAWNRETE